MDREPVRWPGLVVILVALIANAWVPWLQFQYCDWDDIPDVGWMLGLERPPADTPLGGAVALRVYSYRPAFWSILWGLLRIGGGHATPWVFHLFFLCAHAAASWLLYRLVSARAGPVAGTVAGGLFGLLPGGIQAVTWIAAGGDQLAVLFMLLAGVASDHALRTRSRLAVVACAGAAFCAVCSKETALAFLPALGILWVIPPRGALPAIRRRALVGLAAVAGVGVAWAVRARALGTWLPNYPAGQSIGVAHAGALPRALLGFLVPWNQSPELRELAPPSVLLLRRWLDDAAIATVLRVAAALAFLAPLCVAMITLGKRGLVAVVMLLGALVLVIVPVLPLSPGGVHVARAWYPAGAVVSALVASACAQSKPRRFRWALASVVPIALLSIDSAIHVARGELYVASAIRSATTDLANTVGAHPATRFIVIQPPDVLGGIAFLGYGFAAATSPPFGSGPPAIPWDSAKTIALCPVLVQNEAPLQILEWNGRRLAERGPALPPIPRELPALAADVGEPRIFRPLRPVPPRATAGVRLKLRDASGATGAVTWVAGREVRRAAFAGRNGGEVVVGLPQVALDEAWLTAPALETVGIEGVELAEPPALTRELPRIEIKSPSRYAALALSVVPRITFASETPAPLFRVTLEFTLPGDLRIQLPWTKKSSDLPRASDGSYVFVIDKEADIAVGPRLDWTGIGALLGADAQRRGWVMPVRLGIEALDEAQATIGRSSWVRLGLFAEPPEILSERR